MRELVLVTLSTLALAAFATIVFVDPAAVMLWGQRLMLVSITAALPFELLYFYGLSRHPLPPGWYWRSYEHHAVLTRAQRPLILGAFFFGSTLMATSVLGILAVIAATVRVLTEI